MPRWRDPDQALPGDDDLPLFSPMARSSDPDTSKAAAGVVEPALGSIQHKVLLAYRELGPMTAKEAEALPRFAEMGFSTVRKRCSELLSAGVLRDTGERRNRCAVLLWPHK